MTENNATAEPLELTENGAELYPATPQDFTGADLRLGIDVGSTTVKLAVIDASGNLVYANYERHHTDIRATAKELFAGAQRVVGNVPMRVSITGSGGMLLGTVEEIGPAYQGDLKVGDKIATLVSLSLTPLRIDEIVAMRPAIDQVDIKGKAILFQSGIYGIIPDDMP